MRVCLPAVAVLLFASPATAHVADEIIVRLDALPDGGLVERITMTAETLVMLAPIDANGDAEVTQGELDERADAIRLGVWEQAKLSGCTRAGERASLEAGYVALTAQFACGASELTQEFRLLMVLPSNFRVRMGELEARAETRTVHVSRRASTTRPIAALQVTTAALAGVLLVLGLVAWRVRRARWPAIGVALFALGFWLVHRLMT